jgi:hypothetical protein
MIMGDNFGTVTVEPGGPLCEIQLSSLPGTRFQSEPHFMCHGLAARPPYMTDPQTAGAWIAKRPRRRAVNLLKNRRRMAPVLLWLLWRSRHAP